MTGKAAAPGGEPRATAETMEYKISGQTTPSNPGNGYMKFDTPTQSDAAHLYLCDNSTGNINVAHILNAILPGDTLSLADKANADANIVNYTISAVTDNGGWHTLAVTPGVVSGAWPLTGNPSAIITMSEQSVMQCSTCRFWVGPIEGDLGECHCHAPIPLRQLPSQAPYASEVINQAPITTADFWCGEYQSAAAARRLAEQS
jgi:hypothetical protein